MVKPPLGVASTWMTAFKKQLAHNTASRDELFPISLCELSDYVRDGVLTNPNPDPDFKPSPLIPPQEPWEHRLDSSLATYASFKQLAFEMTTLDTGTWEWDDAYATVAAKKLEVFIQLQIASLFPLRFPGRTLERVAPDAVAYAALGVVSGATEGWDIARGCLGAYRKGWVFGTTKYYPVYVFMFRLFSDYLGEPPIDLQGEAATEPYTSALFDVWRTDDLELLAERCVAVLDLHTHRCRISKRDEFHEFDNGGWMRCPIEVLLLFKLRELNGQANPEIAHPLMATALGRLPGQGGWAADQLLQRVSDRMHADGFDEASILERV